MAWIFSYEPAFKKLFLISFADSAVMEKLLLVPLDISPVNLHCDNTISLWVILTIHYFHTVSDPTLNKLLKYQNCWLIFKVIILNIKKFKNYQYLLIEILVLLNNSIKISDTSNACLPSKYTWESKGEGNAFGYAEVQA